MLSKVSSKGQVTIPAAVRDALGLVEGDRIAYELTGDAVIIRKVEPFDAAYHRALAATLDEWNSPEDEEAFRGL